MNIGYKINSSMRPVTRAVRNPGQYSLRKVDEHKFEGEALGGRVNVTGTSEGEVLNKLNSETKAFLDKGDPNPSAPA